MGKKLDHPDGGKLLRMRMRKGFIVAGRKKASLGDIKNKSWRNNVMGSGRRRSKELIWKVAAKICFSVLVVMFYFYLTLKNDHKKLKQELQYTVESCGEQWLNTPITKRELGRIVDK